MASFTEFSSWTKGAQDKTGVEEIVTAYNEHRRVLFQGVSGTTLSENAQSKALFVEIQTWLENNCTSFIDHVNGPLNTAKDDFLYFTLDSWQKAAGLNESETASETWRRRTSMTGDYLYGRIQNDDIRQGGWVFEDLQKGLGALKYTLVDYLNSLTGTFEGEQYSFRKRISGYNLSHADLQSQWDAAGWSDALPANYRVFAADKLVGGIPWRAAERNNFIAVLFRDVTPFGVIRGLPEISRVAQHWGAAGSGEASNFLDIDGLGLVEGEYILLATAGTSSAEFQKMDKFTTIETNPLPGDTHPIDNPYDHGAAVTSKFLAEWEFSYE